MSTTMISLDVARAVAIAILVTASVVAITVGGLTLRYLWRQHSNTWRELGLPDVDPIFLPARYETAYAKAQPALVRFFWRADYKRLNDPKLNRLVRVQWLLVWLIGAVGVATGVMFVMG